MANIKNNHVSALNVGGVVIAPNTVAAIPDWDNVRHSNAVKIWLQAEILEEVGGKAEIPGIPGLPPADPELAEKLVLIDKLATHGITKTTKSGLDKLKEALAAAEADNA